MTPETVVLFVTELFRVDVTAIVVMLILPWLGTVFRAGDRYALMGETEPWTASSPSTDWRWRAAPPR